MDEQPLSQSFCLCFHGIFPVLASLKVPRAAHLPCPAQRAQYQAGFPQNCLLLENDLQSQLCCHQPSFSFLKHKSNFRLKGSTLCLAAHCSLVQPVLAVAASNPIKATNPSKTELASAESTWQVKAINESPGFSLLNASAFPRRQTIQHLFGVGYFSISTSAATGVDEVKFPAR